MATFEAQVEGLTGLSIGTSPTTNELTQFLKDGVIDVTNRSITINPGEAGLFGRESSISDSQGLSVGGAKILYVMREGNIDGSSDGSASWYPCKKISMSMQSRVVDPDSLFYSSLYNPVYTMNSDKTINVYPIPSSNNGFKVFYVNEEPRDITNNAALTYAHSNIKYFPNDKVYLVVIYASIKSLGNALSAKTKSNLSIDVVIPVIPSLSSSTVTLPTNIPFFSAPTSAVSYTNIDTYIDTEEDVELAASKIQEMSIKLQEYQANIQNNLNTFNANNAQYQAGIQKSLQDATLDSQDDAQKIQKYSAEIQEYSAEVQRQVQEWTTNFTYLQADYQWMQGRQQSLLQEYYSAFAQGQPAQQGKRRR